MSASAVRILVIDDEKPVQAWLRLRLEALGHRVFAALDGVQAIMLARQVKPELIVLDLNMPGGGGYVALERLRRMSGTVSTPILIYSVTKRTAVLPRIGTAGPVEVLEKPAASEDLVGAIDRLLGREVASRSTSAVTDAAGSAVAAVA
jgi:two-component system, OmpR family, KDP operon response regulator KdpE